MINIFAKQLLCTKMFFVDLALAQGFYVYLMYINNNYTNMLQDPFWQSSLISYTLYTTSGQHFWFFFLYFLSFFFDPFSSPLLNCLMHVFCLVIINCGHYLAKHNFLFRASFSCQRSIHVIRLRALSLQRDGGKERGGILFQLNAPSSLHTLHAMFDGWKANHFCTNKSSQSQKVETNPWKLLNLTFRC